FSSRRRHTRFSRDWSSDVCSSDLGAEILMEGFIRPGDTAIEGPFGDHTGHYNGQGEFPVLTIERLRLRRDAIYHGSYMGRSPERSEERRVGKGGGTTRTE